MDEDLLKKSLALHGMDFLHILSRERQLNPENPLHADTQPNNSTFNSRLMTFMAKKADLLYRRGQLKPPNVPKEADKIDAYAVTTPIETFMGLPDDVCKKRFFESIQVGDVLVGVVVSVHTDGMIVALLCTDNRKRRLINHLKILTFCPEKEIPKLYAHEAATSAYQIHDKVRGHVISANALTEKIILSLKEPIDQPNVYFPKMGLISENDYPLYYKRQTQIRGLTYDELLNSLLPFHNSKNIPHLCEELNIDYSNPNYSLMHQLFGFKIAESDYAESLRKEQNMKIATKHVKDGVEFFRSYRYFEAVQYFNKALQIEPKHVDALVARGALYANNENYIRAIEDFETAVKIDPQHSNASKYLNQTLIEKGIESHKDKNFDEAMKNYKRALEIQDGRKDVQIYIKFAQMKEPFPDISKIPDTVIKPEIKAEIKPASTSTQKDKQTPQSNMVKTSSKKSAVPVYEQDAKVKNISSAKPKEVATAEPKSNVPHVLKEEKRVIKLEPDKKLAVGRRSFNEKKRGKGDSGILEHSTKLLKTLIKEDKKKPERLRVQLRLKDGERKINMRELLEDEESEDDALEMMYQKDIQRKSRLDDSDSDEKTKDGKLDNDLIGGFSNSHKTLKSEEAGDGASKNTSTEAPTKKQPGLVMYDASSDSDDDKDVIVSTQKTAIKDFGQNKKSCSYEVKEYSGKRIPLSPTLRFDYRPNRTERIDRRIDVIKGFTGDSDRKQSKPEGKRKSRSRSRSKSRSKSFSVNKTKNRSTSRSRERKRHSHLVSPSKGKRRSRTTSVNKDRRSRSSSHSKSNEHRSRSPKYPRSRHVSRNSDNKPTSEYFTDRYGRFRHIKSSFKTLSASKETVSDLKDRSNQFRGRGRVLGRQHPRISNSQRGHSGRDHKDRSQGETKLGDIKFSERGHSSRGRSSRGRSGRGTRVLTRGGGRGRGNNSRGRGRFSDYHWVRPSAGPHETLDGSYETNNLHNKKEPIAGKIEDSLEQMESFLLQLKKRKKSGEAGMETNVS